MLKEFVLFKALDSTLETVADAVLGKPTKMSDSDIESTGAYFEDGGERSGGFLDVIKPFAKKGFDAYRDMSASEEAGQQGTRPLTFAEIHRATSTSSSYRDTPSRMSRGGAFTPRNPAFQPAARRMFSTPAFDPTFNRMLSAYVINPRPNTRRGRVSSVGSTALRTKKTSTA
tara:strand:- start:737 stop:1252 length:516 start_codon:yes stop_codon:yes gene_type:complete